MLALITLATALSAWLGKIHTAARLQRQAVQWVEANGGSVHYGTFDPATNKYQTQSVVPRWLLDLVGKDYFLSVKDVHLEGRQIEDITPLAPLEQLEGLVLTGNYIGDITPLSRMTKLEYLSLSYNQVTDLSPLRTLTALEGLAIEINGVSDISPLASLKQLRALRADNNAIRSLEPLRGLTELKSLDLKANNITDISVLGKLPKRPRAEVYGNPIPPAQLREFRDLIQ